MEPQKSNCWHISGLNQTPKAGPHPTPHPCPAPCHQWHEPAGGDGSQCKLLWAALHTSSAAFPSLPHLHIQGNSQVLQPGSGYLEKLAKLQHLDLSQSPFESSDALAKSWELWADFVTRIWATAHTSISRACTFRTVLALELLDLPSTPLYISTLQSPF